tara:strand:+ start:553 stop:780 length:228 start_codon:yes stop_codon:yes gene_type:complete
METWKKIIELANTWQHTKRIPGTSIQENEDIFITTLDTEFLIIPRNNVKEIRFEDDYVVYLVNEEESNEERYYDA